MEPASAAQWIAGELEKSRASTDFDAVVREYWPRVFRFALVSLRDRSDAESLTQDCFLKAFQAWERFRGDASIHTWLMRIAVNQIRDHARSKRLQFWKRTKAASRDADGMGDFLSDGRVSPEMGAVAKEQVAAVWRAAASLPERQKSVFLLRFVEDLDLLEIAAATGLKQGTVKAHLFRALQAIRTRMSETK